MEGAAEVLRPAEVAVEATAATAGWRARAAEKRTAEAIMLARVCLLKMRVYSSKTVECRVR